jgi:hypothetical protein
LLSHPLPEPQRLGASIRTELEIAAPRMIKYAKCTESTQQVIGREFEKLTRQARNAPPSSPAIPANFRDSAAPYLSLLTPEGISHEEIAEDLAYHSNRYAPVGTSLQRIGVRFGWSALAFAEIRDLNRHRTGNKYCPQVPKGFYFALDQIPAASINFERHKADLLHLANVGSSASTEGAKSLRTGEPSYIYWSLLGTEFPFEHITTADNFIYEAELRTGLGAHFRYAKHLRDAIELWYRHFPETKHLILEGSAEPE